jgi:hypothetical protein
MKMGGNKIDLITLEAARNGLDNKADEAEYCGVLARMAAGFFLDLYLWKVVGMVLYLSCPIAAVAAEKGGTRLFGEGLISVGNSRANKPLGGSASWVEPPFLHNDTRRCFPVVRCETHPPPFQPNAILVLSTYL